MNNKLPIELSTSYADVYFRDDIFYTIVKPDNKGTLAEMKEHLNARTNRFKEQFPVRCVLINNVPIKPTTKEYRDYAAGEEMKKLFTALAIVMENNPMTKIAGNLFLKFSRPAYPTKIFNDERQALNWLKQY